MQAVQNQIQNVHCLIPSDWLNLRSSLGQRSMLIFNDHNHCLNLVCTYLKTEQFSI
jgi:hypothetical protein